MQHFNEFLIQINKVRNKIVSKRQFFPSNCRGKTILMGRLILKIVSPRYCSKKIRKFWDWTLLWIKIIEVDSSSLVQHDEVGIVMYKLEFRIGLQTVACDNYIWEKVGTKTWNKPYLKLSKNSAQTKSFYFQNDLFWFKLSALSFTLSALLSQ